MSTLSIPITAKQESFIAVYIKDGKAKNKAEVVHKALDRFVEDEAVNAVLEAERELGDDILSPLLILMASLLLHMHTKIIHPMQRLIS